MGKGENAGYQHFLIFPKRFLKVSLTGSLKVGIVRLRVKNELIPFGIQKTDQYKKSVDSDQPVRTAQVDLDQHFLQTSETPFCTEHNTPSTKIRLDVC